ncbi:MAG: glutaredoxin family protein [Dehalococcoidia bacterium]|nr:glutaredoxin family protein [Dehalococcoidia bacterium]
MRPVVRLLGKSQCRLCEEARAMLEQLQPKLRFIIEDVNVELDPSLRERFGEQVPVVEVNGEVVLTAPIRKRALEDALEDALAR